MGRHMSALAAWPGLARRDRGFWVQTGDIPPASAGPFATTRAGPEPNPSKATPRYRHLPATASPSSTREGAGMEAGTLAGMAYETYTAWLDRQPCWPPVHEKRTERRWTRI